MVNVSRLMKISKLLKTVPRLGEADEVPDAVPDPDLDQEREKEAEEVGVEVVTEVADVVALVPVIDSPTRTEKGNVSEKRKDCRQSDQDS